MAEDRERKTILAARLSAFGAPPTPAIVTTEEVSPGARVRRAMTGLAACWLAAGVAVFLPVLHLVLVPTLVVGGIAAAVVLGRQARRVLDVQGTCPRCLKEVAFEAGGHLRPTRLVNCPRCHTNVTLAVGATAADAATAGVTTRR
jgi:endogenous inhibitor of DNA gyrase (YacG/DUF329 family)